MISEKQSNVIYRFISDYPFKGRAPHAFDDFERNALIALRQNPSDLPLTMATVKGLSSEVRLIAPITMSPACVSCHNSHPDSTKRDWKVGDVRGI